MATVRQHRIKLKKKPTIKERTVDWFTFEVFDDVPDILRLTQDDEGKRIWLASESQMNATIIRLANYKEDILEIVRRGEKKYHSVYKEEAILHPEEITKKRLEKFGYEIKDGRKNA